MSITHSSPKLHEALNVQEQQSDIKEGRPLPLWRGA